MISVVAGKMEKLLTLTAQIILIHVTWRLAAAYPNLATQTTNQSTIAERTNGVRFPSSMAVDGSRNTDGFAAPYCAHTLSLIQSWWKVQLNMSSHINEIRIWLRSDQYGASLPRDYDIYLSDSGTCGTGTHCVRQNPINHEMTVTCAGVGQWVVICGYTNKEMLLVLCEVEIYGCPKEKYGDECLYLCGNCMDSSCSLANGSCPGECKANYWGEKCSEECPGKCSDPACRQSDGICIGCVSRYWGDMCSEECPVNCGGPACIQDGGICTGCVSGYWGVKCSEECPNGCDERGCTQASGICFDCDDGLWGDNCSMDCPSGCNVRCTQDGSVCLGCKSGYWGNTCDTICGKCSTTKCGQNNGSCVSECNAGYVFPKCVCSIHCNNEVCNGSTFCTNGCKTGYFGLTCSNQCNINCLNDVCHRETGNCSDGCIDTYWGKNCSKSCPNCKNNVCDQNNGMCLHGCVDDGFWGTHCKPCPDKCAGDICKSNGDCFNCLYGYTGIKCQDMCHDRCFGNRCDQISSSCLKGCEDGWWGERCTEQCPVNCAGNSCEQETRVCDGCVAGYWSKRCNEVCSSSCVDKMCNQYDATCIIGVISSNQDIAAGAVGAVIGALAVIMLMLMFLLRRRLHRQNKSKATTDSTATIEGRGGTDMYNSLSSNRDVHDYDSITTVT